MPLILQYKILFTYVYPTIYIYKLYKKKKQKQIMYV